MSKLYRYLMKNPSILFMCFYILFIWQFLITYFKIDNMNYIIVFLIYLICYGIYEIINVTLILKKRKLLSFILFLIGILSIYLTRLIILDFFNNYILSAFYTIKEFYLLNNKLDFLLLKPIVFTLYPLLLILLIFLKNKLCNPIGMILTGILVMLSMILSLENELEKLIISFLFLSTFEISLLILSKTRRTTLKKAIKLNLNRNIITATTILFLISAYVLFIPLKTFGGTKSFKEIKETIEFSRFQNLSSSVDSEFNIYTLGYGDKTTLGGSVQLDPSIVFKVEASSPVYLRGNIKDYYNGNSWHKSWIDMYKLEKYYIHEMPTDSPLYKSGAVEKLKIYPINFSSSALLAPINTIFISNNNLIAYDKYYIFYNIDSKNFGKPYTVTYKNIYFNKNFDYTNKYITSIYNNYLQIPRSISSDTKDLVYEIIKDAHSTSEKIEAIRSYLISNFEYSTIVRDVQENADFVENFLFNEKKGYCTYFATTAAIMFRIAGIPSRYVQGFKMDDTKDHEGLYLVSGDRAHAWVEVLVSSQDKLWTIVECTPSIESEFDISITSSQSDNNNWYDYRIKDYEDNIDLSSKETLSNSYTKTEIESKKNLFHHSIKGVNILFFILILILVFVFFIVRKIIKLINYKNRIINSRSIIPIYMHIRKRLSKLDIFTSDGLSDFEELSNIDHAELREYLTIIISLYYDEYYGDLEYDYSSNSLDKREVYKYIERYVRKNKRKNRLKDKKMNNLNKPL